MRLRTKLLLGFLSTPVFFLGYSVGTYLSLSSIRDEVLELQRYTLTMDLMSQASGEIAALSHPEDIELGVLRAHSGGTAPIVRLLVERLDRGRIHLRALERLSRGRESKIAATGALQALKAYKDSALDYADAMRDLGPKAARGKERQRAAEHFELIKGAVAGFSLTLGEERRREVAKIAGRLRDEATQVLGSGFLLVTILTIASALFLSRLVARDIISLHKAVLRVERGDLDLRVEVRSHDEIGELTAAFNDMIRRLRQVYRGLELTVQEQTETIDQRERELIETQKLAALGRLSAGVAHELGGPLTIIAASAEGLLDRAHGSELREHEAFEDFPEYLELIEGEAYRLKKVIRRLLDFARPRPPRLLPVDLRDLVSNAVTLARLDPRARQVAIEFEPESSVVRVECDADGIQECVLNLIFNALDAVGDGAGERVSLRLTEEEEWARLDVEDDGMGMEGEVLRQVFEPFFTTKPEGKGTGLGLALAVRGIRMHGGFIRARSEGAGQGACFEVRLPLLPEGA